MTPYIRKKKNMKQFHLAIDGLLDERIKEYLEAYPLQTKSDLIRSAIIDFIVSDDARQAVRNANKIYDESSQSKKIAKMGVKLKSNLSSERGDVPGWVLVVLMTTGLVTAIWTIAAPRLSGILKNSLDAMNGIR